jgi:hypothetical protein
MTTGYQLSMYKNIIWNTGAAAERARHNLRLKNKRRPRPKAASSKRQAASIRVTPTGISLISCKDPKRLKKDTIK